MGDEWLLAFSEIRAKCMQKLSDTFPGLQLVFGLSINHNLETFVELAKDNRQRKNLKFKDVKFQSAGFYFRIKYMSTYTHRRMHLGSISVSWLSTHHEAMDVELSFTHFMISLASLTSKQRIAS